MVGCVEVPHFGIDPKSYNTMSWPLGLRSVPSNFVQVTEVLPMAVLAMADMSYKVISLGVAVDALRERRQSVLSVQPLGTVSCGASRTQRKGKGNPRRNDRSKRNIRGPNPTRLKKRFGWQKKTIPCRMHQSKQCSKERFH